LEQTNNNHVYANTLSENLYGITVYSYGGNTVESNVITKNQYGLGLSSDDNKIYHNKFVDNSVQAEGYGGTGNLWDNGYPSGGNYWSDYAGADLYMGPFQNETGSDGIGDIPHFSGDRYPLINPWPSGPGLHELRVNLKSPIILPMDKSATLETTVHNDGIFNETDVNLFLFINDTQVGFINIPFMEPGTSNTISYSWTPTVEGVYNVTAYATPLTEEIYAGNNRVTSFAIVRYLISLEVPYDYSTIQEAINAIPIPSMPEDTIFVHNGTYYEHLVVNKTLSLVAESPLTTIIDGASTGNVVSINADDVHVTNFTILDSGMEGRDSGIHINSTSNSYVNGNNVTNNWYGIYLSASDNAILLNNDLSSNAMSAIYLKASSNTKALRNTISNNNIGIYLYASSNNVLSNNIIRNNTLYGVGIETLGEAIIEGNYIFGNSHSGVMIVGESNVLIKGNIIEQNKNGIATDTTSTHSGILIVNNTISSNQENGIYLYSYNSGEFVSSYIYNITVENNTLSFNVGNGIYLHSYASGGPGPNWVYGAGGGYIYDVAISKNTFLSNSGKGIYLYSYGYGTGSGWYPGGGEGDIYNVTISDNTVLSNGEDGVHLKSYGSAGYGYGYGKIFHVFVSNNTVLSNLGEGLYVDNAGDGFAYLYDVKVSSNKVSLNLRNGIYLYSVGYYHYGMNYGYLYDVTFSNNNVSSNNANGVYIVSSHHKPELMYDLAMFDNMFFANYEKGVWISGGINANFTRNSVSFNSYGIFYTKTTNNVASYNDIYRNIYGMYVTEGATVNAEYNYWGDATGPYHASLNPNGKGNSVNGNGTDLDFIPFLTTPIVTPDLVQPTTLHDYDDLWYTSDFTITLTANDDFSGVAETYYKINEGPTKTLSANGQPLITTEGANNKLEYWSVDNAGNEELPHKILTGIKLDKTYPTVETPSRTPDGDVLPDQPVKVSVNVTDAISQVKNVTLYYTINDGETWTDLPMNHTASNLYEATIPPQQADTTVRFKIVAYDHAGNTATLDGTQPYCTYQVIPEFPSSLILPLFMGLSVVAVVFAKRKPSRRLKT
jgi:parallel beta-helix repeat protein